jgi:Putative amidase domain
MHFFFYKYLRISCRQYYNTFLSIYMFIKNIVKNNWHTVVKFASITIILAIAVPIFTQQIQADAVCTEQLRQEIQKQIDTYDMLEKAPTVQERGQENKKKFNELKSQKTDVKFELVKNKLIEFVKNTYSSKKYANVDEDFTIEFNNINNKDIASVHKLIDYKDGNIDESVFEFNLIIDLNNKITKFEEINPFVSIHTPEEIELNNKLNLQNVSALGTKLNDIGQTDEDLSNLLIRKKENEKLKPIVLPEEAYKNSLKDKRQEYKNERKKLEKDLQNATCSNIKVNAGNGLPGYDRNASKIYALSYSTNDNNNKIRNQDFANFSNANCTNFVSQSIQKGGYKNEDRFYSERIGVNEKFNFGKTNDGPFYNATQGRSFYVSPSFRSVTENARYLWGQLDYTGNYNFYNAKKANGSTYFNTVNGQTVYYTSLGDDMFQGGRVTDGDIVWADWQNDGLWDHTMIITGWYWDIFRWKWMPKLSYNDSDAKDLSWSDFMTRVKVDNPNPNFKAIKL